MEEAKEKRNIVTHYNHLLELYFFKVQQFFQVSLAWWIRFVCSDQPLFLKLFINFGQNEACVEIFCFFRHIVGLT